MRAVAGVTSLGEFAAAEVRQEEASIVAELKAGNEDAYSWLIAQYHQPIYNLVYRILDDPADAPDTTQEVFLKIFRGIESFHGESSLKTWMYRIAVHEASNRRRWFFRHKGREVSIAPAEGEEETALSEVRNSLVDEAASPFDVLALSQLRQRVEQVLTELAEPYRTTVVLRDIEELSYEQIAEVTEVSLGTVKSRLVRGRDALKKRLERHARELGLELGPNTGEIRARRTAQRNREIEVTP